MIGRDKIKEIDSVALVDDQINKRQSRLNELAGTVEPQIISEEIVELRTRRTELEERLVRQLMEETGMSSEDCRISLIRSNWNIEEAKG
jgi:hypothetical protein